MEVEGVSCHWRECMSLLMYSDILDFCEFCNVATTIIRRLDKTARPPK